MKSSIVKIFVLTFLFLTTLSCSRDEPAEFTANIDATFNSLTLSNGDELEVYNVKVTSATFKQGDNEQIVSANNVERVEYFIGNRKIGESETSPYSITHELKDLKAGTHQLRIDVVFKDVPKVKRPRVWVTYDLVINN